METVDLSTVVTQAVETSRPQMEARRHVLGVSLPSEPLLIRGDLVRLSQVVANLLNNAARYTEPGGQVELTLAQDDGGAVLTVRDNGIGMAPEVLGRVFDLFVQAERSSGGAEGGLGIGLTGPHGAHHQRRHRCTGAGSGVCTRCGADGRGTTRAGWAGSGAPAAGAVRGPAVAAGGDDGVRKGPGPAPEHRGRVRSSFHQAGGSRCTAVVAGGVWSAPELMTDPRSRPSVNASTLADDGLPQGARIVRRSVSTWLMAASPTRPCERKRPPMATASGISACSGSSRGIADWGDEPTHHDYAAAVRERHGRKASFWRKYEGR